MELKPGPVTRWLAIVTGLAFLLPWLTGFNDWAAVIAGFIPARLSGNAMEWLPAAALWVPVWLTPLTATLVHGGLLHIGFNLLMLLFGGSQVEQVLRPGPTIALYVAGAYGAALAQWAFSPASDVPMVGASGAISALLGTYALLYSQQAVRAIGPFSANAVRILWLAAGWIGIQAMIGFIGISEGVGEVAVAAHIGGFLVGLLLTRPLLRWRFRGRH